VRRAPIPGFTHSGFSAANICSRTKNKMKKERKKKERKKE
jgi:hypothetical protein